MIGMLPGLDFVHLRSETMRMIDELQEVVSSGRGADPVASSNLEAALVKLWKGFVPGDPAPVESDIQVGSQAYPNSPQTVQYLIVYYLLENNCADAVERLIAETGDRERELKGIRDRYIEFKRIVRDAEKDSTDLLEQFIEGSPTSDLELYLTTHKFLLLIRDGRYDEALRICFRRLKLFVPAYIQDVKPILRFLVNPANVNEALQKSRGRLIRRFESRYLEVNGMPNRCHLKELFETGTSAFLQLSSSGSLFFDKDDSTLPMEIKIERGRNYHSLFVCPVLKTLCVDENVPVMLECGHVISLEAANVLSQEGVLNSFKCPYCPEMSRYENVLKLKI